MKQRERLIELLNKKYDHYCDQCGVNKDSHYTESLADYLLENGVIVLPCKVGDKVYECVEKFGKKGHWEEDKYIVDEWEENIIRERKFNLVLWAMCWGETVFLTREEAEQALKGGAE